MKICVFGGSTTWGEGDCVEGGWVNMLRNNLAKSHSYVYNLGISGDTTNEMISRAKAEARARKPELIIFSIGLNDSAIISPYKTPRVPLKIFLKNIAALLEISRDLNTKVLFIGPTSVVEDKTMPIPWDTTMFYTNSSGAQFDKSLDRFCDLHKVPFLSLVDILSPNDISLDGLHPNTDGHRKIFEIIKPAFEKIISEN